MGDIVLEIDDMALTEADGAAAFSNLRPGQTVKLRFERDGATGEVVVTGEVPPAQ